MSKGYLSRIPKLYEKNIKERVNIVSDFCALNSHDFLSISKERTLDVDRANLMIENVIGIFSMPIGIAPNFIIDGIPSLVPMCTEEPSVIAACSHIASLVGQCGGFTTASTLSLMKGQILLVHVRDVDGVLEQIQKNKMMLIDAANQFCVGLKNRGGGCKDVSARALQQKDSRDNYMVVVDLSIDCCDAMGANIVNTVAERLAPMVESLTGARAVAKILSNLCDQRMAEAHCRIPFKLLCRDGNEDNGFRVASNIVDLYLFAVGDVYRACTHNKGIMNGVDAVCIATGNDFRAVEAAAHAYAAREGTYTSLSTYSLDFETHELVCGLRMPLAVGVVGGSTTINPAVALVLKILGPFGAKASMLARLMAAVGLAQNLGALRALATEGIQRGHMHMHARKLAIGSYK